MRRIKRLYKYRRFTERNLRMLVEDKLYFCRPTRFNDPFDCAVSIDGTLGTGDSRAEAAAMSKLAGNSKNAHQLISPVNHVDTCVPKSEKTRHAIETAQNTKRNHSSDLGVCAFSQKSDLTLLWAHYADRHRGFCIEFRNDHEFFTGKVKPVKYKREYPVNTARSLLEGNGGKALDDLFLVKSVDWRYEHEWRAFTWGDREIAYPDDIIVGVIFGCRMPQSERDLLRYIFRDRSGIEFKEVRPSRKKFALEISAV